MEPASTTTVLWVLAVTLLTGAPQGDYPQLLNSDGCFAARDTVLVESMLAPEENPRPAAIVCIPTEADNPDSTWDMVTIRLKGYIPVGESNGNYTVESGGAYTKLTGETGCFAARNYLMDNRDKLLEKLNVKQATCISSDYLEHDIPQD